MRSVRLALVAVPVLGALVLAAGQVTASSSAEEIVLVPSFCSATGTLPTATARRLGELTRDFKRPAPL